jgi:hypothetical protein
MMLTGQEYSDEDGARVKRSLEKGSKSEPAEAPSEETTPQAAEPAPGDGTRRTTEAPTASDS